MMKNTCSRYFLLSVFLFSNAVHAMSGIETEAAKLKQVSTTYMLDGVVEAEQRTTISAQTAGTIKELRFDVNDFVAKNMVVAVIDDKQQQSSLKQAQAAQKEASVRLEEAQSEYDRVEEVYRKNVVSKADFDKVRAALNAAKARLESAQAASAKAREQLEYTQIRAPFSGILTQRHVEIGESVDVGTQVVSGISLERLRVNTFVPQSIIKQVSSRRYAIVITDDSEIVSTEMTYFPFADPLTHSFQLRIDLPQIELELLPGMFVKVALEVSREDKTVIPFNAVAFRGEVTGIYVLEDQQLHFRHVRLGRRLQDNEVVVLAGVEAGELIVTDPVEAAIAIKQEQQR